MEEDSFELSLHLGKAKKRISELYYQTAGSCYLSFSGGKDSTVVLNIIKEMQDEGLIPENSIPAVFVDTGIELQATKNFVFWVKENYYQNVEIIKPKKSFGYVINEHGKPFRSKIKSQLVGIKQRNPNCKSAKYLYDDTLNKTKKAKLPLKDYHVLSEDFSIKISNECCNVLKKEPFKRYVKLNDMQGHLTGMRAFEGGVRLFQYEKRIAEGRNPCTSINKDGFISKSPLIDWNDDILNEYIAKHKVPLSKAYTEYGRKRTGCFLCPFDQQLEDDLANLHKHEPNQYKAALHWLKDIYIAQNVKLPFDEEYERERERKWRDEYEQMRYEMLIKYGKSDCVIAKNYEKGKQLSFLEE